MNTHKQRIAEMIQLELKQLTSCLIGSTPRIKESTIITVWLLGLNLTPKQVHQIQPQLHDSEPTLSTVYKISSRFKDTIKLLKEETQQHYQAANLL